ncbi:MAG: Smr/MutS family protein [Polyangiales bacterium]
MTDWRARWEKNETGWDIGVSAPALSEWIERDRIHKKRVFVGGCGAGHDLYTLAKADNDVVGVDLSSIARDRYLERRTKYREHVTFLIGDFFTIPIDGLFEAAWDYTFFCAIDPEQRDAWVRRVHSLLAPDGILAMLVFPIFDADQGYRGPPWPMSVDLVTKALGGWFSVREVLEPSKSHPSRVGKEKLMIAKKLARSEKIEPSEVRSYEERVAFSQAFSDVKPLKAPKRAQRSPVPPKSSPPIRQDDDDARERLGSLVSGGLKFSIDQDRERIRGLRVGTHRSHLVHLSDAQPSEEATIDLHGLTQAQAKEKLTKFVRDASSRGEVYVLAIHGKGSHSAGGGVLRDAVIDALTKGGAAPRVIAFCSAPRHLGGSGALLVKLER